MFTDDDFNDVTKELARAEAELRKELKNVNIVIAGASGVGKSTLINAIFGKRLAETGKGRPLTMTINKISSPELPISIFDTRGLEIQNSSETMAAIDALVRGLRNSADPDEQIHIVWLCILATSNRIEDAHTSLLSLFGSYDIPAIVILTQYQGEDEFVDIVKDRASTAKAVIPIMAEPLKTKYTNVPVIGLADLVQMTMELIPESRVRAFEHSQRALLDMKVRRAREAINIATAAAASSAFIPVPGGHSVALLSIQATMIVRISIALGLQLSATSGKDLVTGIVGILVTKVGGTFAFGLVVSEIAKFIPGLGTAGGIAVGAAIGGTLTKLLGHVYLDVALEFFHNDTPLPATDVLSERLKQQLENNISKYRRLAESENEGPEPTHG